jgi:hypothetical protein
LGVYGSQQLTDGGASIMEAVARARSDLLPASDQVAAKTVQQLVSVLVSFYTHINAKELSFTRNNRIRGDSICGNQVIKSIKYLSAGLENN